MAETRPLARPASVKLIFRQDRCLRTVQVQPVNPVYTTVEPGIYIKIGIHLIGRCTDNQRQV